MPASQKYLKIAGVLYNYKEDPVTVSYSTSSPAQAKFTVQVPYTSAIPIVDQLVEWFLRDDTKVWSGAIASVNVIGNYEGSSTINVEVTATGLDDRLFRRTTWNRNTFKCAQYRSFAGKVDTAGTAVTWKSNIVGSAETSNRFGAELAGKTITINGASYVVATVDSPEDLTLASSAGTQADVDYAFLVYCGDAVKDLLESAAYPVGRLDGGFCEFEGFSYTGTSVQPGALISNSGVLFDPPVPIHDAIQTLLDANPDFYFATDVSQVAYFAARTLVAAPADITPTSGVQKRGINVTETAEDVRNVEISQVNWATIDPLPESFSGNLGGTLLSWFTSKEIHEMVSVQLNGVDATVAEASSGTVAKFYFNVNTREFWQDHSDPPVIDTDVIDVQYRAVADNLIEYEYPPTSTGGRTDRSTITGSGFGRYEKSIDRTNFSGKTDALGSSTAQVTRLAVNYKDVEINTFHQGYLVGQSFVLDVPKLKTNITVFIDEVTATDAALKGTQYDFEYTLRCISVSRRITELDVLRSAFSASGGGGGSSSVSGGSGGGGGGTGGGTRYTTSQTLTAPTTISAPGVPVDGDQWAVLISQDATGGRAITWGSGIASQTAPRVTLTMNSAAMTATLAIFWGIGGVWYCVAVPQLGVKL